MDGASHLLTGADLADATIATVVSVIGGLVVALLTAPHPPVIVRALRRWLRSRRNTRPVPATEASPRFLPPPPPRSTLPPLPPAPPSTADFARWASVAASPRATDPVNPNSPSHASASPIELTAESPTATRSTPHVVEPTQQLVVRLLGPIAVDGLALRDKALAVLSYLAVHRAASGDALEDACWTNASSGPPRKRLKDVVSECRATVGADHLPHATRGLYRVGPNVVSDLSLFDRAVEQADGEAGLDRARHLHAALDLVRGRIFAYPTRSTASFGWIDLENLISHWELRIEDTAEECALLLADAGQSRDGVVVLLRILEVLPLNVRLTEALMAVHAAAGERHMVDAVFRAHAEGLARLHECDPEETTAELRAELLATTSRRG